MLYVRHVGLAVWCGALLVLIAPGSTPRAYPSPPVHAEALAGYSADAARVERDWERQFRALPTLRHLRESMRRLSARPHHVGSAYNRDNAEWLLAQFKAAGLDAHVESFDVLFPTPKERVVELVAPRHFLAALHEPAVAGDPTSTQQRERLPTYNAYSKDGDVTAPLVYANYGMPADYEELERHGVRVAGAIVIVRYGHSWRGIKPKVAAEHGAIGCLLYSDPAEDGYAEGDVFPAGEWRPPRGVQRGSVMDVPVHPGDPLTPGTGATPGAERLRLDQVEVLTKIPVLPLSYADAQPLLSALRGPVGPAAWRGALPITYRLGPGPARVHLVVRSNWDIKRIFDLIVRIPGREAPDEWVIRGNHYDAWVNGAWDPISGQAALLEEARALGALVVKGWHPRRTIIYCAWDGEEPGLLGSTEWVETHADELREHTVAYLNTDNNERGYLDVAGSHVLETFMNGVARDIIDPETNASVWQRRHALLLRSANRAERNELRARPNWRIGALGSGSDYSAFVQHLGIAAASLAYSGESPGDGIYHSAYDDFTWYTHFGDTSFVYGRTLAQTVGTAVMRLADAQLIPFDFEGLAETVQHYVGQLDTLATSLADSIAERNREVRDGVYALTSDPWQPTIAPDTLPVPPHLNLSPLRNGADALTRAAVLYTQAVSAAAAGSGSALERTAIATVDTLLLQSERTLTAPQGLPGRPWYRHLLYAPGLHSGYGVKTIPGVREAVEQRQWALADSEAARAGAALEAEAALVARAAAALATEAR